MPGRGGRAPVAWLGSPPARTEDSKWAGRRPVVAVFDTGAGDHSWLTPDIVERAPEVAGLPIGMTDASDGPSPEARPSVDDPLEGVLDPFAGHGTFICGVIRQACPDANILMVRAMHGDGAVPEHDFIGWLNRLVVRQAVAESRQRADLAVDVVSLSMGYYHELPADVAYDQQLLVPLKALGELGVTVVAAAGNDATSRHMYPAGFAPHDTSMLPLEKDRVPVVSVGALNPNKVTRALFSNAGPWVTCYELGAAVVSTTPDSMNGSLQPGAALAIKGAGRRATIDPDDYRGGFAVWSGTSFASPVMAGKVVQNLVNMGDLADLGRTSMLDRGWTALSTALTSLHRPPS